MLWANVKIGRFRNTKTSVNKRLSICLVGFTPTCPALGLMGVTFPSHPRRGLSRFYISRAMVFETIRTDIIKFGGKVTKNFWFMQIKEQNFSKLSKIFKYLLLENIDSKAAKRNKRNKRNTFLSKDTVYFLRKRHFPFPHLPL